MFSPTSETSSTHEAAHVAHADIEAESSSTPQVGSKRRLSPEQFPEVERRTSEASTSALRGEPPLNRPRVDSKQEQQVSWSIKRITIDDGPTTPAIERQRPGRAHLSREGRVLPELSTQSLGQYFSEPVGKWPSTREKLTDAVITNLRKMADVKEAGPAKQLHREVTLHWHCLSEAEKSDVLNAIGSKTGPQKAESQPKVLEWLEHTAAHMEPGAAQRLLDACTSKSQDNLVGFAAAGTEPARTQEVKQRSALANLRMTMPADHMYDYAGFYEANKGKVGNLSPEKAAKIHVGIVGAGPAGLMAAHLLNHLGINATIYEAEGRIGGRLATDYRAREDGTTSPTATHPGGMRFHQTEGNFYWYFAKKHYNLDHMDFTNPSQVGATLLLSDKVATSVPGVASTDPVQKKVEEDYSKAMGALLKPMRDARDAGDTARFRELYDDAKKRFDPHNFKDGVELLLKDQGIKWTDKHWEMFGAVGVGVGGYKGYFNTGFLEEMRFLVDERLEKHQMIINGADEPLRMMIKDDKGLPEGRTSLEEQKAIKLNAPVTDIDLKDGKYHLKAEGQEEKDFDTMFFAAGPKVAINLGLTKQPEGGERILPVELSTAIENANIVGATKMAMTVPADEFHPETLPKNLQSTAEFQQLYLHPPAKEGNSAVIYLSYTLGDNAKKVEGKSKEEQIETLIKTLRDSAKIDPETKESKELTNLANLIEKHKGRASYTHWTEVKTQGGAFKMDAPDQLDNSRALYAQTLEGNGKGAYFINEQMTNEAGFASGALAAAVNAVQDVVLKHGGTLPPNSPRNQMLL